MKKLFFAALLLLGASFAVNAQGAAKPDAGKANAVKGPKMVFVSETIDYGKLKYKADGNRIFKFKNVGDEPLVITSARGSCGCTVPTYTEQAIQPGKEGEIKVTYATDRVGPFTKGVSVVTNEKEGDGFKTHNLTIKGEVAPQEEQKGTPDKATNPFNNNN
jgi:hypothetical protein